MFSRYEVYTTVQSIYCYPDSNVLKNKLVQSIHPPPGCLNSQEGGMLRSIGFLYQFRQSSSESSSKE